MGRSAKQLNSFYAWHREGEYGYLQDATDRAMLPWVQKFNPYDLYSKNPDRPQLADLRPYYENLLAKYLPPTVRLTDITVHPGSATLDLTADHLDLGGLQRGATGSC